MKKFLITGIIALTFSTGFSQTFNEQRMDSLFHLLEKNNKFMGSIAISQNGKLIYSNTIGYSKIERAEIADSLTKYRIGSISKMFTASLILRAVEEKKLSLNQTIDIYFPQIENSNEITVENLLNHKSGIHDFTNNKNFLTYNTQPKSEMQMIEIIAAEKSDFEPNSKVEYSNSNYIILSYILERIYKQPYSKILETKIIKPLGLINTYFGSASQSRNKESRSYHFTNKWDKSTDTDMSIPMGAGAILSNPTDLNIFIEQLFRGNLISQNSLALMTNMSDFRGMGVGMGMLEFKNFEQKNYGHNGAIDGFQSILCYFPEEKLSVAITSNALTYPIENVLLCAVSSYFNKAFTMPSFKIIEVDPKIMDLYLGQYVNQQTQMKIIITKNDNKLSAQVAGQNAFTLEATAANIFIFEQAGVVLEFESDKKQMSLKQGSNELLFSRE